ncbi:hypothetical protein ATANTOWER_020875 [Ataeniobius toweri]|uniref:Secreted protein n=1 Tax=Ataeniobius toweri TaxID=208326 RepID=A0ABU7BIG1_9TELE|nr:hypothetical protein [Ataeniobius toweri]
MNPALYLPSMFCLILCWLPAKPSSRITRRGVVSYQNGKYLNKFTAARGPPWIHRIRLQNNSSICPACPPSNVTHRLEELAHTAYQSANLSFHGLLTCPSLNRFIKSKPCLLFIIQTIFQLITVIFPSVS